MDDLLSKLVGAANGGNSGGLDPSQLAQLMGGAGLSAKDAAALLGEAACNAPNEQEMLAEDEKMENVGHTYDLFIQNELPHTSHTLEWLPISHADPEFPEAFEFNYFLIGTHAGEPEQ